MQAEMPQALDIEKESAATRELYGIGPAETDSLGRRCLMARRLVEKGVRFVQVYAGGWDSHDYIEEAHRNRMRAVDRPIAALLKDLKRAGLLDSTLVISCAREEFAPFPIPNGVRRGSTVWGRDHNAQAMAMWFAGGGVKAGHVIGATDEFAPAKKSCRPGASDQRCPLHHPSQPAGPSTPSSRTSMAAASSS